MKTTLFILLILGAVFFFAGNQVLTVGDAVLVLLILWLYRWQAKKRAKEIGRTEGTTKDCSL